MMARRGFTVVEMLVVIAVITIISSMVLANYRSGEKRYAFSLAVQNFVSDLRKAQNLAVSGAGSDTERYCGYGIYIDASNEDYYILYKDLGPGGNCEISNNKYDEADFHEIMNLPENVIFLSSSPSPVDIFFKLPEPVTYINEISGTGQAALIDLGYENEPSMIKTIMVTGSGLIEIDPIL